MSNLDTPLTAPPSPFFEPQTPQVTVVHQTPGGTKRQVQQKAHEGVKEHKSGLAGCTANLINAIVGSGIVGIPYAIRQAGFGAGIILVVLCSVMTDKSLRLLVATAKHVHCPSYETAAEAAYGKIGFRFITISMLIMAYGAMVSYLMIVKDSFSMLLGVDPQNAPLRRVVLLVVSIAVQLPLSSKRDVADLAFTSRLNVIIDSFLVVLVLYNAPIAASLQSIGGFQQILNEPLRGKTIFVGLGVLSFAFVCQHSAFIIAGSLEKPTLARWSTVTRSALIVSCVLALLCGVSGFLGYLDETNGNILENLDPNNWTANAARGMLGVCMLFVYPMESFVARHVCVVLLFAGRRAHEGEDSTILNRRDRRIGLTALLYVFALVPAAWSNDLGPVLALTGAIGGSCLSYIGPGLLYLGVHGDGFLTIVKNSWLGSLISDSPANKSWPKQVNNDPKETTPLVVAEIPTQEATNTKRTEPESELFLVTGAKWFLWCLLGFPIWCYLARMGKTGLERHARDMAMKSPHPIRIGDVEYTRLDYNHSSQKRETSDASKKPMGSVIVEKKLINHSSFSDSKADQNRVIRDDTFSATMKSATRYGLMPPSQDRGTANLGINQMLGKELLLQQKQKPANAIEKDPQGAPPSWYDFAVAIYYVLFGVLALFAGIFSLFREDSGR